MAAAFYRAESNCGKMVVRILENNYLACMYGSTVA